MSVTAETITDQQMREQRSAEHRARDGAGTNWNVIYAIDRVRGHASRPELPGDRELIAAAWNARHGDEA